MLRSVQSVQYFFLENVFINIQNLIYGISIALEVNELHTLERSLPDCIPVANAIQHFWSCELVLRRRVIHILSYLNTFELNF